MTKDEALRLALEALEMYELETNSEFQRKAITAIKSTLEAKDEPVAYLPPTASPENACYTPPQRTWVGLTDEQAMDAYFETPPFGTYKEAFIAGIRFIEAAHGIKGQA